jgi:regulator of Ty1 transposition protein 103
VKTLNMAFTEDSLKAKLSSLNETQDAISTVGQWILFHR